MHLKALRFGAALLVSVALHGCGGSGSDTDAIEGSGVTQNVTNIGAITGIAGSGEITVNGDTVGLSGASIDIDGDAVTAAELKVGHVVTVRAPYDAGATIVAASAVSADILVAGRIEGLDIAANRITILRQLVEIDAGTVIEGLVEGEPFGGLTVGSDVEVSGFTDSQGVIFARHIEARRSATPLVVTGAVSGLDTANKRMSINGKEVDYADATLTGFGSVSLDGATVQVNGDVLSGEGELHATEVVYQDKRVPGNVDDEVRLEGWVTRFASPTDFDVDGHPVTTTPATQTNGPMDDTIGIVRLDAFVSIKGKLIADGVIEAYEITTNNIIDINASITRFDSTRLEASGRFANHTCDLDGAVIEVDDVPADWHALHVGDIVTIHELFDWQSLRPEPPEGWPRPTRDPVCKIVTVHHSLRGTVDSVSASSASLVVMGQKVWIAPFSTVTGTGTGDVRGALTSLLPGDIVEVSGLTTAQGDIVASNVTRGPAERDYRIASLARNVDTSLRQLTFGTTVVDYSAAELVGFPSGQPVELDKVIAIADAAPVGGLMRAKALRYAANPSRGEYLNLLYVNGLITRFATPRDFDIEGRRTVPLPHPSEPDAYFGPQLCDPALMHENLSISMLATTNEDGNMYQIFILCGGGERKLDFQSPAREAPIEGSITALDPVNRSFVVSGVTVHVNPATTFTVLHDAGGTLSGTLATFDDLAVGLTVGANTHDFAPNEVTTDAVWWGD